MSSNRRLRSIRIGIGGSLVAVSGFAALTFGSIGAASAADAACGNSNSNSSGSTAVCPVITLSNTQETPGGTETITGSGYAANEQVTLVFNSTAVTLGTTPSDASGAFSVEATIPTSAADGDHTITGTDTDGNTASAALTVSGSAPTTSTGAGSDVGSGTGVTSTGGTGTLAATGSETTKAALIGADLLLLGAPLVLVTKRRRAR